MLMQFWRTGGQEAFEILAYCFMPDHGHFLLEGWTIDRISRVFVSWQNSALEAYMRANMADLYGKRVTTNACFARMRMLAQSRATCSTTRLELVSY